MAIGRPLVTECLRRRRGRAAAGDYYDDRFYRERNYSSSFGMLAGVRNGRGFAGCDLEDGFIPIGEPRGLPEDVSDPVRSESDRWDTGGHSHSWLTVAELMAYDWTRTTKHLGHVDARNVWRWLPWGRENGQAPKSWCGFVSGDSVKHATNAEMGAIAAEATVIRGRSGYEAA